MAYTTIKKSSDYFNTVLWNGNSSAQSITGIGFQPDFIWNKSRNTAVDHRSFDAVVGENKSLLPNDTYGVQDGEGVSSFDTDGFSFSANFGGDTNVTGQTYVAWNWLASNTTASNTDGSITSTVSANTTSGFSIVSYTGTGANATVGHGLGSTPKMIIIKELNNATNWIVYHAGVGNGGGLQLNTTIATDTDSTFWNSTTPTSSVFSLGSNGNSNGSSDNYIAYCFADVQGFSKFGSYTGNGQASTSSPFIYTGFKPAFVIIKNTIDTHGWSITDNKRNGYNENSVFLYANTSDADASYPMTSFYSNGFQPIEAGADKGATNQSGDTYIYMAFAEEPLVGDNPATAR
jgi:hypothetical protein